ncbi:MAG: YjbQ family protein [Candidatus Aenigmarchaeota archaeon]|nr:YjbQ family protein [Candidatus Aenigmarchaeota archaeon]
MEFKIQTKKREEIVDITKQIEEFIKETKDGVCTVFVPHATCAILINENYDPSVCEDILKALRQIAPHGGSPLTLNQSKEGKIVPWLHDKIDGNGDAHIKSAIIGPSETIPVKDGKLQLGTWQNIGLAEFDGPRERKIIVKFI